MYLELKNDDTACFYEDPDLKMMKDYFRFKRYCSPSTAETLCFEAEITKNQFQIPESKLYFHLMADGSLCRVLSEKRFHFIDISKNIISYCLLLENYITEHT